MLRAQTLEKKINADRAKIAALDEFRRRPQADLDVLNELTRLLPPPIWTSAVEIYPDSVIDLGRGGSGRAAAEGARFFAAVSELGVRVVGDAQRPDRAIPHQDDATRPRRTGPRHDAFATGSARADSARRGLVVTAVLYFAFPSNSGTASVAAPNVSQDSIGLAQQRLVRLRQIAATVPGARSGDEAGGRRSG